LERCSTHCIPYFWVKDPNPPAICHERRAQAHPFISL
jgi:hypothetical protein